MNALKELEEERGRASTIILDQLDQSSNDHISTIIFFSDPSVKIIGINWRDGQQQACILLEDITGFKWQEPITVKKGLIDTINVMALFEPMISHLAWIDRLIEEAKKVK